MPCQLGSGAGHRGRHAEVGQPFPFSLGLVLPIILPELHPGTEFCLTDQEEAKRVKRMRVPFVSRRVGQGARVALAF